MVDNSLALPFGKRLQKWLCTGGPCVSRKCSSPWVAGGRDWLLLITEENSSRSEETPAGRAPVTAEWDKKASSFLKNASTDLMAEAAASQVNREVVCC